MSKKNILIQWQKKTEKISKEGSVVGAGFKIYLTSIITNELIAIRYWIFEKKRFIIQCLFLEEHDNGTNIMPVKWFIFSAIYNFENVYKNKQNF